MTRKKDKKQPAITRQTLRLPVELWDRIKSIADQAKPTLSANQVVVLMLDYATKELPKIRWIFETLPKEEGDLSSTK